MDDNKLVYPTTFKNAELASAFHQRRYIQLKKLEYGTIILASFIAIFPFNSTIDLHWPSLFSGLSLLVAVIVLFIEKSLEHHKGWYKSRALAEAVKAESWKFRCGCSYYSKNKSEGDAIRGFLEYLSKIRSELNVNKSIAGHSTSGDEISQEMKDSRNMSLEKRVALYKSFRVDDQIQWYSNKANTAGVSYRNYFIGAISCLLLGVIFAIARFLVQLAQFSFVGFISAIALTLFGWMQIRRYETLSITYTNVVTELRSIAQVLADTIQSEQDLDISVRDAELVISKEHTIWVTKGEVV